MQFKFWLIESNFYSNIAINIEKSLPPVKNGYVRLWRGNRPGEVGLNPQFTNSLDGIALPFQKAYGGPLTYVDVPKEELPSYEQKSGAAPGSEFVLPPNIFSKAQIVNNPLLNWNTSNTVPKPSQNPDWTNL